MSEDLGTKKHLRWDPTKKLYFLPAGSWSLGQDHYIDFYDKALSYRIKKNPHGKELLRDAIRGRGPLCQKRILDACMGLGHDAIMMCLWGHRVHSFERHPELFSATQAAWSDYCVTKSPSFSQAWQLHEGDFWAVPLNEILPASVVPTYNHFDILYFDPMYNRDTKSQAKAGKSSQFLHHILEPELRAAPDAGELGDWVCKGLELVREKVIVKRPLKAPVIPVPKELFTYSLQGKSTRYDVFLRHNN